MHIHEVIIMKNAIQSPCICIMLRRAAGAITELYDKDLEECGISVNQFSILTNLKALGTATTTELAEKIGLDRSTLVRNLKAIIKQGYIENISREKERDNRLQVTESGRQVLGRAYPIWLESQKRLENYLGKENTELLMDMLFKLQKIE